MRYEHRGVDVVPTNPRAQGLRTSAEGGGGGFPKYAEYRKFLWVLSDWVALFWEICD